MPGNCSWMPYTPQGVKGFDDDDDDDDDEAIAIKARASLQRSYVTE